MIKLVFSWIYFKLIINIFFICISTIFLKKKFIRYLYILQYMIQKNKKSIQDTIYILTTIVFIYIVLNVFKGNRMS